jgi:hypothetical protein
MQICQKDSAIDAFTVFKSFGQKLRLKRRVTDFITPSLRPGN